MINFSESRVEVHREFCSSSGLASGSSFTVLQSESVAVVVITSEELLADEVSSDVGRI